MDPNNSDPTNQPQQDTTQTDADQTVQPQQPDDQTQQSDDQTQQSQPAAEQNPDQGQQAEYPVPESASVDQTQPADQGQPQTPAADDSTVQEGNYIEDVGGSVIDLLDDIDGSDNLVKIVANEMRLDDQRVRTILSGLLAKIDQNQLTIEELALIMAAPVVDEVDDQPQQ
jgi:hypothetical protein